MILAVSFTFDLGSVARTAMQSNMSSEFTKQEQTVCGKNERQQSSRNDNMASMLDFWVNKDASEDPWTPLCKLTTLPGHESAIVEVVQVQPRVKFLSLRSPERRDF